MKSLAELAGQWEIDRWASAMRDVVADIRADAKHHRAESTSATTMESAISMTVRADECDRIAEMLNDAIEREVSR